MHADGVMKKSLSAKARPAASKPLKTKHQSQLPNQLDKASACASDFTCLAQARALNTSKRSSGVSLSPAALRWDMLLARACPCPNPQVDWLCNSCSCAHCIRLPSDG